MEFSITSDLAGQTSDLDTFLRAAAGAGFQAVHWCHDWIRNPVFYDAAFAADVKRRAADLGLRIADVHGAEGWGVTDERADGELWLALNVNRVEFAGRVGASALVVHLLPRPDDSSERFFQRSVEKLQALRPACRAAGVRLAVENLPNPAQSDEFLDAVLAAFAGDGVGLCYDSGHAVLSGQQHLLARHVDRLLVTHLHDNDGTADQHQLPGLGRADWPAIAATIAASDYHGTLNLELHLPEGETSEAFCRRAYATIRDLWEQGVVRRETGHRE